MRESTIFALSSGSLPSGVAVVRISGPQALVVAGRLCGKKFTSRSMTLEEFRDPKSAEILDQGLLLCFPGPASFTGEDVAELHCHGGIATVSAVLDCLSGQDKCRLASAGEFSRQAFENGKLDLTELEGLADLVAAQTESQRKLALAQSGGSLKELYENWRSELIRSRALIEAHLDFSDEEDVPSDVSDLVWKSVDDLRQSISNHLDDDRSGEIIRDGFRVALMGPPNAGKSSLLNALAQRDVAIVTDQPGTTRDVIDVQLDVGGSLVILYDTAGIRQSSDTIELEGMRRANQIGEQADLVLWLKADDDDDDVQDMPEGAVIIRSKADLVKNTSTEADEFPIWISTMSNTGLDQLLNYLKQQLDRYSLSSDQPILSRKRHRIGMKSAFDHLTSSLNKKLDIELRSEYLRLAGDDVGRITGRIDVEDLLDVIFSEFCVGK